jgi:predicted nuclease of predicted toxin-antitoxin system
VRILADENVPRLIVSWLRACGQDVLYAAESRKQTPDADLLIEAEALGYVLLTEDKDFVELVFRDWRNCHGVILLQMEDLPSSARLSRLQGTWTVIESLLPGKFVVLSGSKLRVRPLTPP